jgi:hypothetical protein
MANQCVQALQEELELTVKTGLVGPGPDLFKGTPSRWGAFRQAHLGIAGGRNMPISVIVLREYLGFFVAICKLSRRCLAELHAPHDQVVILTIYSLE